MSTTPQQSFPSVQNVAPATDFQWQNVSLPGIINQSFDNQLTKSEIDVSAYSVNKKAFVTSNDITKAESGWRDLNPRPLAPQASETRSESSKKPDDSDNSKHPLHQMLHQVPEHHLPNSESRPPDLGRLITELASLPPDQRAAIAALLMAAKN